MQRLTGFTKPPGSTGPDFAKKIEAAIGKAIRDAGASSTDCVVEGEITESDRSAIQSVINSYVYDPNYGVPAEDLQLGQLRTKAQAVFAGADTFTNAQVQKLLAALVLRTTR